MPELPEVEAVARSLAPLIEGQKIVRVQVFHPIATRPQSAAHLVRHASGKRLRSVARKGKYLLLRLDRGLLTVHFRLDGQLLRFRSAQELKTRANTGRHPVHIDLALELSRGVLGFADRRHLGRVHAWPDPASCPVIATLGTDPLSAAFTARRLSQLLGASRRSLKEFLLEQSRLSGIGNIYSCEALWHAKLDPRRRASSIRPAESRRLHKAIVSVLRRALECCLHPAPDFRDPDWWFAGLEQILRVYGRQGQACAKCGGPVRRIRQGSRSTYFCPHCQQ